jgi:hypothetical protein
MSDVKVTVAVGSKQVAVADVKDRRIATAFAAAGKDIGDRLAKIMCPAHGKSATNVRVNFDKRGNADLQYDSCCEALGAKIGEALG